MNPPEPDWSKLPTEVTAVDYSYGPGVNVVRFTRPAHDYAKEALELTTNQKQHSRTWAEDAELIIAPALKKAHDRGARGEAYEK